MTQHIADRKHAPKGYEEPPAVSTATSVSMQQLPAIHDLKDSTIPSVSTKVVALSTNTPSATSASLKMVTPSNCPIPYRLPNTRHIMLCGSICLPPSEFAGEDVIDWRSSISLAILSATELPEDVAVFNPHVPSLVGISDYPAMQVQWEQRAIKASDILVFWFGANTIASMSLVEATSALCHGHPHVIVGVSEDYKFKDAVNLLLQFADISRTELVIVPTFSKLVSEVVASATRKDKKSTLPAVYNL